MHLELLTQTKRNNEKQTRKQILRAMLYTLNTSSQVALFHNFCTSLCNKTMSATTIEESVWDLCQY